MAAAAAVDEDEDEDEDDEADGFTDGFTDGFMDGFTDGRRLFGSQLERLFGSQLERLFGSQLERLFGPTIVFSFFRKGTATKTVYPPLPTIQERRVRGAHRAGAWVSWP